VGRGGRCRISTLVLRLSDGFDFGKLMNISSRVEALDINRNDQLYVLVADSCTSPRFLQRNRPLLRRRIAPC
jgi:hypothetical protein